MKVNRLLDPLVPASLYYSIIRIDNHLLSDVFTLLVHKGIVRNKVVDDLDINDIAIAIGTVDEVIHDFLILDL